jgi:hypothetical protein
MGSCTVKDITNAYRCIQLRNGLISHQTEYLKQKNRKTGCWSWHCSFDNIQCSRQAPAFLKAPRWHFLQGCSCYVTVFTSNLGERGNMILQNTKSSYKIIWCHNPENNLLSSHCMKTRIFLLFLHVHIHIDLSLKSHENIEREWTYSSVHLLS